MIDWAGGPFSISVRPHSHLAGVESEVTGYEDLMQSGQMLAGRYRLDGPIASGGMGDVWRATDAVLGRTVAIKVLRADQSAGPSFGARFRAEARTLAALHHPGVVEVYDYGEISSNPGAPEIAYLVMAFIDGEPLSDRLARFGRLSPAATMSMVAQTADALHAAHSAGIVHRDVKPGNVLINGEGRVVLVDFGIAHTAATEGMTGVRDIVGTARYMAPEQALKRPLAPATDVYSLGILAYECLAGTPPFSGNDAVAVALAHVQDMPPPLPADVPAAVGEIVMTAMAKDPALRFATAAAMAAAARHAADSGTATIPIGRATLADGAITRSLPPVLPPTTAVDRPVDASVLPRSRSRRGVLAAVASLAVVGVAIAAVLAAAHPGTPSTGPSVRPPSSPSVGSGSPARHGGGSSPGRQSPGRDKSGKPTASSTTSPAPAPSTAPPRSGSPTGGSPPSAAPSAPAGGGDPSGGGGTGSGGGPGDGGPGGGGPGGGGPGGGATATPPPSATG
jgi:eukaryotic-like serine/threonine-protein kinase